MSDDTPPRQRQLSEFDIAASDSSRCEAYAERTGERCRRNALPQLPYCEHHIHLYDPDVDGA